VEGLKISRERVGLVRVGAEELRDGGGGGARGAWVRWAGSPGRMLESSFLLVISQAACPTTQHSPCQSSPS
jgi:hypothetical protein